jgi:hypothetical protein
MALRPVHRGTGWYWVVQGDARGPGCHRRPRLCAAPPGAAQLAPAAYTTCGRADLGSGDSGGRARFTAAASRSSRGPRAAWLPGRLWGHRWGTRDGPTTPLPRPRVCMQSPWSFPPAVCAGLPPADCATATCWAGRHISGARLWGSSARACSNDRCERAPSQMLAGACRNSSSKAAAAGGMPAPMPRPPVPCVARVVASARLCRIATPPLRPLSSAGGWHFPESGPLSSPALRAHRVAVGCSARPPCGPPSRQQPRRALDARSARRASLRSGCWLCGGPACAARRCGPPRGTW